MGHSIFAHDLGAPEGPVGGPDGSLYVTEMSGDRQCISHLDQTGARRVVVRTGGRPNGLAIDGDGNLWIAEAGLRALLCVAPDGRELARIDGDADGPFLFPNDLAFGPDGHLYMTDSGMALTDFLDGQNLVPDFLGLAWDGRVYEIDPVSATVLRRIDRGILFTNGIAFDAAGALYVNASFTGEVYRYDLSGDAAVQREVFGNVLQPDDQEGFKGPDGMAFGTDGRLYCTVYGQGNITVLERDGTVAERLPLEGRCPTNCAFALEGTTLLVTEVDAGRVERLTVGCGGLALHAPSIRRAG